MAQLHTIERFVDEYRFLSNFAPVTVVLDGVVYPSVEHAYVAAKSEDPLVRAVVLAAATPGAAKKFGRTLVPSAAFEASKLVLMEDLLYQKFATPQYAELLLATNDAVLVEGNNWHDCFWGVCTGCEHGCSAVGLNHLGRLLTEVRAELAARM